VEVGPIGLLPDFANQIAVFKNAGIYFGEYNNMLL
jgi:hypothetical protein